MSCVRARKPPLGIEIKLNSNEPPLKTTRPQQPSTCTSNAITLCTCTHTLTCDMMTHRRCGGLDRKTNAFARLHTGKTAVVFGTRCSAFLFCLIHLIISGGGWGRFNGANTCSSFAAHPVPHTYASTPRRVCRKHKTLVHQSAHVCKHRPHTQCIQTAYAVVVCAPVWVLFNYIQTTTRPGFAWDGGVCV